MAERKVLQKYYPPDFDPSKLPRKKAPPDNQTKVRLMLPMTICCNTCGEYVYKGKKFNAKKETVIGEDYLGIKIYRFYIKCTSCSAEITFKTDPKNSDYATEFGASRNFEPWRETDEEKAEQEQMEKEQDGDPMKALENRTVDSKTEMDILDALDELRALNAMHAKIDTEQLIEQRRLVHEEKSTIQLDKEDEELVSKLFKKDNNSIIRIDDTANAHVLTTAKKRKAGDMLLSSATTNTNSNTIRTKKKLQLPKRRKIASVAIITETSESDVNSDTTNENNSTDADSALSSLIPY